MAKTAHERHDRNTSGLVEVDTAIGPGGRLESVGREDGIDVQAVGQGGEDVVEIALLDEQRRPDQLC